MSGPWTQYHIHSFHTGSCMDPTTGKVNEEKLKQNLSLVIDAYIRVDNCPCGETSIHLYKGPTSDDYQLKRAKLPAFLKSRKSSEKLKIEDPELYNSLRAFGQSAIVTW